MRRSAAVIVILSQQHVQLAFCIVLIILVRHVHGDQEIWSVTFISLKLFPGLITFVNKR